MVLNLFVLLLYSIAISVEASEEVVCENKLGFINCPVGQKIQIDNVLYGRTQQSLCNQLLAPISNLNCRSSSVSTNSVTASCQGRSACLLRADNNALGEYPCPAVSKYLQVTYQCVITIQTRPSTSSTRPTTSSTSSTRSTTSPTTRSTTPLTTPTRSTPSSLSSSSSTQTTPQSTTRQSATVKTKDVHTCHEYLISGPHGVPDAQLSASSALTFSNNAHRARLYLEIKKYPNGFMLEGAWTANTSDKQPYIEVKLNWLAIIQGVVTQGRHINPDTGCCKEWVTKYVVHYSIDGQIWKTVQENNVDKVFIGNTDGDTIVTHMFDCPITARFVRIEVKDYFSRPSLRFELNGCPTNTDDLGNCPKGWKERPGSDTCYYISDQSDLKTWEKAEIMCKRYQGNMVKIETIQERDWIISELQSIQKSQKLNSWWTGLNNRPRFDNNYYKWGDGSQLDRNILHWLPSEPNNSGGEEHCAIYDVQRAALNDLKCDTSLPFICELSKYWQSPINVPGLQTHTPALPSTVIPTTVSNLVPVPVTGGNVVTVGQSTFYTGCSYRADCVHKAWGDYSSCQGCHHYLTCAPSGAFDRTCPHNLKFDANLLACSGTSSTCRGP